MNDQSPSQNDRKQFTQIFANLFTSQRVRALLFVGALIIALIISASFQGFSLDNVFFFPAGIVILFLRLFIPGFRSDWATVGDEFTLILIFFGSAVILWVVYLAMMVKGITGENVRTSKVLFLAFVLLLFLNIEGCAVN